MKKKNSNVLITGGCGFIGSHLVEFFVKKKIKVIVLDKKGKRFSPDWLKSKKNKNIKIFYDNVENYKIVEKLIKKVDYVIHLAALISIPHSYKYPKEHLNTNIIGTFNILAAIKKYKKKCIITSTSETYGSGVHFPMTEKHQISAQSPYAASKISADQLAFSFHKSFGTKIKIIRPFNCFGPRQSPRAVIPNMILQMLNKKNKVHLGNTNTFRDYTYVEDLCNAYWLMYKSSKGYGEVYNVGTGKTQKISNIFKKIKKISCYAGYIEKQNIRYRPKKSEVSKLHSSYYKIKKTFGWKPKYSFNFSLKETILWYSKNLKIFKNLEKKYSI